MGRGRINMNSRRAGGVSPLVFLAFRFDRNQSDSAFIVTGGTSKVREMTLFTFPGAQTTRRLTPPARLCRRAMRRGDGTKPAGPYEGHLKRR